MPRAASLLRAVPIAAAVLSAASRALAQGPSPPAPAPPAPERIVARLDFRGVPGCSDPEPFIVLFGLRVKGWDPVSPRGPWKLVVTVKRHAPGYEGSDELRDPTGKVIWTRAFPPNERCFALLDRLSLA